MTTITTRAGKGSALTYEEMDANLTNLNEASVPAGGTTGQVLTKTDGTDYNTEWSDPAATGLQDIVDDTTPQLGGDLASNGNDILFADNDSAVFGTGSDLTITHNGTSSQITNTNAAGLYIKSDNINVMNAAGTEFHSRIFNNGSVELYHDNVKRFQTTNTGADVVGNLLVTGSITLNGTVDTVDVAAFKSDYDTNKTNWNTAYSDRLKWDGGATGLDAATGRTSLGLGTAATTNSTDYATAAQGTKADTAYGWGDHALAGYLTSYTETDPIVGAVTGIVKSDGAGNISAAVAGTDYLASFTETDPVVGAVTGIVKSDGAGNISAAVAGTDYIANETDPVVGAITGIVKADGAGNISAAVAGTDYIATESDPVFSASPAAGITSTDITNWDTAYGWGDHAAEGYLKNIVEDTTPQLGANLDAQSFDITNVNVLQTDGVQLDTAASEATAVGKLVWDAGEGTVSFQATASVDVNVGQSEFILCYNGTGGPLSKGQVVYISGAQGNRPSLALAIATGDATSAQTLGVVAETIANGAEGNVMTFGILKNVDTTGFSSGSIIFLSPDTAGAWTATKPYAPDHMVYVGYVIVGGVSNGRIFVKIQNGYELDEIHDADIGHTNTLTDNDHLVYDSASSTWRNEQLDISQDTSPTLGGNLDAASYNITGVTKLVGAANTNLVIDGGNNGTQQNVSFVGDIDLWEPTSANSSWITNTNLDYSSINRLLRFKTAAGGSGWSGLTSGDYQGRIGLLQAYNNTIPASSTASTQNQFRFGQTVGGIISSGQLLAAHPLRAFYKGSVAATGDLPNPVLSTTSSTTSSTNTSISTGGTKTFTVATGLDWASGMGVYVQRTGDDTRGMVGSITSYNSGTGSLSISLVLGFGSGTYNTWTLVPAEAYWVSGENKFYYTDNTQWLEATPIGPNDFRISTNTESFRIASSVEAMPMQQSRLGDFDRTNALYISQDISVGGETWGSLSGSGWGREQIKTVAAQPTIVNTGSITSIVPFSGTVELRPHGLVANSGADSLTIYGITGQSLRVGWTNQSASGDNRPVSTTVNNAAGLRVGTYNTGTFTVSGYSITNTIENFYGLYWSNGSVVADNKYSVFCNDSTVVLKNDGPIQTSSPLRLATYDAASVPGSGSAGDVIAIGDNGGKLAYWDTANTRWSYVSDDSAV